jgi:hypothetical protein
MSSIPRAARRLRRIGRLLLAQHRFSPNDAPALSVPHTTRPVFQEHDDPGHSDPVQPKPGLSRDRRDILRRTLLSGSGQFAHGHGQAAVLAKSIEDQTWMLP